MYFSVSQFKTTVGSYCKQTSSVDCSILLGMQHATVTT